MKIRAFFVEGDNRDFAQILHFAKYLFPWLSEETVFSDFREYGGINEIIFSIIFAIFCFSTALGAKMSFLKKIFRIIAFFEISEIRCYEKVKI